VGDVRHLGGGDQVSDLAVRMSGLRRLYQLIGRVNGGRSLAATLQSVVDGVVEGLGFGVAVVNYVHPDGTFETIAVAGSADARAALLGSRQPRDAFDADFALAEHWGGLRFVPHERLPAGEVSGWVPPAGEASLVDAPDAWHPLDALFAPLTTTSGELVGMLSVDLPHDGRRPGALQRELLEMFATQAGIAIENARLTEQLQAEHELLVREQQRLKASEEAFRLAFDGAAVGMSMIDLEAGRFLRVNQALCAITGYSEAELTARTFADITHPEDLGPGTAALARAAAGELPVYRLEKRFVRADGSPVWVGITTSVVRLETGEALHGISQIEDITARKAADAELSRRASHDPLTGLLNRAALRERLTAALRRTHDEGVAGAVLFCDLDGFKAVNDNHGHDVGDHVLAVVAARLAEQVRDGDAVARLGGDEFVVVAEALTTAEVLALAERIEQSLAGPMVVGGVKVAVTVSIGIAVLTRHTTDIDALLRDADAAMYQAKAAGRNGHVLVGPAQSAAEGRRP
jgi:diguanylate cyclase (GGDEF)-like protein/PAS domain S-box-containing protein